MSGPAPRERRTWTLNVCPECNSAVAVPSAWVPPEFVRNCRHSLDGPGWDTGRNVPRVPVTVVERAGGDEAAEFSEEQIDAVAFVIFREAFERGDKATAAARDQWAYAEPHIREVFVAKARKYLAALAPAGSPEAEGPDVVRITLPSVQGRTVPVGTVPITEPAGVSRDKEEADDD